MKQKIPRHLRKELKEFNRTLQDHTQWEKRDWPLRARESTDEILKELKMEIVEAFAGVTCHPGECLHNLHFELFENLIRTLPRAKRPVPLLPLGVILQSSIELLQFLSQMPGYFLFHFFALAMHCAHFCIQLR